MTAVVTVLLPFHNASATLREAAESVLSTRDLPLRLLLINDHSSDDSPELADALAKAHPNTQRINSPERGLVAALNHGLHCTTSPFVARMDADDWSSPVRLTRQHQALARRPDRVAVMACQVELFGDLATAGPHTEGGMARYVSWQNSLLSAEDHRRALFIEAPLCHPTAMMRTEQLRGIGGYRDEGWAEDFDLWHRVVAAGLHIEKIPEPLFRWRQHPGQLTRGAHAMYSAAAFRRAKAHFLRPLLSDICAENGTTRTLVIWGAGPLGKRLARDLEAVGIGISAFVDVDPAKIGRTARQKPILSFKTLEPSRHFVLSAVGSIGARDRIEAELLRRGFAPERDYWLTA